MLNWLNAHFKLNVYVLNNTFKIKFHLRIDFLDLLRFLRVCNEGRAYELATKRLKTSMIDDKNLIFKN